VSTNNRLRSQLAATTKRSLGVLSGRNRGNPASVLLLLYFKFCPHGFPRLKRCQPELLREFVSRKITLIIPSQGIDTSKAPRKAITGMLDAIEEFKRVAATENIRQGLVAARKRGTRLGRPQTVNAHCEDVKRLRARGLTGRAIASELGIPSSTVFKLIGPSGAASTQRDALVGPRRGRG
jgi:Resolvase, N terminal domain